MRLPLRHSGKRGRRAHALDHAPREGGAGSTNPPRALRKPALVAAFAAVAALGAASGAFADSLPGVDALGPPSVAIASGSGIVAAGVGTELHPDTPASFTVTVPADATVKQVLLYWQGHFTDETDRFPVVPGDEEIRINGHLVLGTSIGGPTRFFGHGMGAENWRVYRADITSLGLVSAGTTTLTVSDMLFVSNFPNGWPPNQGNDGAGVLVVYESAGATGSVEIRDGLDLAYTNFAPPLDATVPQTFTFPASSVARTANLATLAGSVAGPDVPGPRANQIVVTFDTGGDPIVLDNPWQSRSGLEFDALNSPIVVPAGATAMTVQAVSGGPNGFPASFAWSAAALSLQNPPAQTTPTQTTETTPTQTTETTPTQTTPTQTTPTQTTETTPTQTTPTQTTPTETTPTQTTITQTQPAETPRAETPASPALAVDVGIVKTDAPDPASVGGRLEYTLTVTNHGAARATAVVVADELPAAVEFVSVSATQGSCTGGRVVRCELGALEPRASATVRVVVRPLSPGLVSNTARVATAEPDTDSANDTSTATTTVVGPFTPPRAVCPQLVVSPRMIPVGRRSTVVARVRRGNAPVRGARVVLRGAGVATTARTGADGIARVPVKPPRTGIIEIRIGGQPVRCGRRIGVVGIFRPPKLTG